MKLLKETYEHMFVGIAIFVGGMVTIILLMKYLNQPASAQASPEPIPSVIPVMNLSKQLDKINNSINLQIPKGTFENRTIVVDDTITLIDKKEEGGLNWHSCDCTNDGPSGVYIGINKWDSPEAPLPAGQSLNINMGKGAIDKLYLKAETGGTATLRFYIIK